MQCMMGHQRSQASTESQKRAPGAAEEQARKQLQGGEAAGDAGRCHAPPQLVCAQRAGLSLGWP